MNDTNIIDDKISEINNSEQDNKKTYLEDCNEALKNLWINVDKQLPIFEEEKDIRKRTRYLVRILQGSAEQEITYNVAYMQNPYHFNIEMDWVRVTHWMPIPSFDNIISEQNN